MAVLMLEQSYAAMNYPLDYLTDLQVPRVTLKKHPSTYLIVQDSIVHTRGRKRSVYLVRWVIIYLVTGDMPGIPSLNPLS